MDAEAERLRYAMRKATVRQELSRNRIKTLSERIDPYIIGGIDAVHFPQGNQVWVNYAKPEQAVDAALLFEGPQAADRAQIEGQAIHAPYFPNYIRAPHPPVTEHLGQILKGVLSEENVERIKISESVLTEEGDEPQDSAYAHPEDLELFQRVEDHRIWELRRLSDNPSGLSNYAKNQFDWYHIRASFKLLDHLRQMSRFTHEDNPEVMERALPDGSNLNSKALRISWALHRAWIRVLHYRTLYFGEDPFGFEELKRIRHLSEVLHAVEVQDIPFSKTLGQFSDDFMGLGILRDQLFGALTGLANDLCTETRDSVEGQYIPSQTLEYNAQQDALFKHLFYKYFQSVDSFHEMAGKLLVASDEFERRLTLEHVEDCLLNKRIVVEDEAYMLNDLIYDPQESYTSISDHGDLYDDVRERYVTRVARSITSINLQRRNFLLLRDWSKLRLFKQVYLIFDTSSDPNYGEKNLLKRDIKWFYAHIDYLADKEPLSSSPSRRANIFSGLFPIHPLDSNELPARFQDGCAICLEEYESSIVVELNCGHVFHHSCIREYFDKPGINHYLCPVCRSSWLLHEQAGIHPEVIDVFDKVHHYGEEYTMWRPNIPSEDEYWAGELDYMHRSHVWDMDPATWSSWRSVRTEMVHMRTERRRRNQLRRHEIQQRGMGILNIDGEGPTRENPGNW
ncbi:hypothetical protein B7494_g2435 [Chlorociboria aeruginascens]|nr:hypothetical protein B7494_g2435 [Chlorociboria aeruginascens]